VSITGLSRGHAHSTTDDLGDERTVGFQAAPEMPQPKHSSRGKEVSQRGGERAFRGAADACSKRSTSPDRRFGRRPTTSPCPSMPAL
jgi:hypothetical protein